MKTIQLTPQQWNDISDRRRHAQDRRIYQRLSAVLWSDDGRTREEIAELVGVSTRQVGQWLRIFRNKGLEPLCTLHYRGDPGCLRPAQVERLKQEIATGAFHNAEQVRTWVQETLGVDYSSSGIKDVEEQKKLRFIRRKRAPGLERGGHADSTWSCVKGLQIGRSACPPACCITPSASAATSTPAPTTRAARRSSPSARSPRPAAAPPAARREVISRGQVERRFRTLPIGSRATFVVLPIPRVECQACGVVRQVKVPFADPRRSYTKSFERYALELGAAHDHPRRRHAPRTSAGT